MRRLLPLLLLGLAPVWAEEAPPLSGFDALLQRPLFTPGRRPSGGAAAAHLSASSLRLTGLVIDAGRTVALVRGDDMKSEARVAVGASLNGWLVTAIGGNGLELAAAGQHLHVGLKQAIPPSPE